MEKTGICVNNSDIIGADMDHCKGLFADGMEYWTPSGERFFLNSKASLKIFTLECSLSTKIVNI